MTTHRTVRSSALRRRRARAAGRPGHRGQRGSTSRSCSRRPATSRSTPGFVNTASCTSAITYIDGDAGILRYRGYPIEQLAEKSTFLEVAYLLIYGELPTADAARRSSTERIRRHTLLHEDLKRLLRRLPARRAPDGGAVLGGHARCRPSTRTASTRSTPSRSRSRPSGCWRSCRRSRRTPTRSRSASRSCTRTTRSAYVENFLRMTFGFPAEQYEVDPVMVKALDLLFILHADHEQNCSTSTVRLVGSSAGQPVRLGLGRHQRAVRPAARRRQPGRARDARADPGQRRRRRRLRDAR